MGGGGQEEDLPDARTKRKKHAILDWLFLAVALGLVWRCCRLQDTKTQRSRSSPSSRPPSSNVTIEPLGLRVCKKVKRSHRSNIVELFVAGNNEIKTQQTETFCQKKNFFSFLLMHDCDRDSTACWPSGQCLRARTQVSAHNVSALPVCVCFFLLFHTKDVYNETKTIHIKQQTFFFFSPSLRILWCEWYCTFYIKRCGEERYRCMLQQANCWIHGTHQEKKKKGFFLSCLGNVFSDAGLESSSGGSSFDFTTQESGICTEQSATWSWTPPGDWGWCVLVRRLMAVSAFPSVCYVSTQSKM